MTASGIELSAAPEAPPTQAIALDTLPVLLDAGEDLNGFYDRKALDFFHGPGAGGRTVYSSEGPG